MVTLQYLEELSFVLNSRRLGQAKASSVGDLLNSDDDQFSPWITPEESFSYGQERRPPYIIPRITSYRYPPQRLSRTEDYTQNLPPGSPPRFTLRDIKRQSSDHAPGTENAVLERRQGSFADISKRFGSTENMAGARRPTCLQVPGSDRRESAQSRRRKSRSMLTGARLGRSPVPSPRAPDTPHTPIHANVIFEGKVKRTKVSENGKKLRKNWTENYLVVTNTHLLFYKDEKAFQAAMLKSATAAPPSPVGSDRGAEFTLPLSGASVCMCTNQHTSRFAKALAVTIGSDQVLIQDDSATGAKYWLEVITKAISNAPPELHVPSDLSGTPISLRKNSAIRKVGESSNEDLTEGNDKTKVKKKLKKFLNRRPTREQLIKKGFYKDEPVFGRSLEAVCRQEAPRVPEFVERCVQEIESSEENLDTDGLYRASGNLSQVQRIRLQIDQNNLSVVEQGADVHVLAGSLKLFFRELKEPLVPCKLFNRILAATGIKNHEARVREFRDIVNSLPQCNYDTLKFLLRHLLRVTEHSDKNRMRISNLAIVFGPTLLWAPPELQHNIAIDCIQQNNAIEILLTDFHEIFNERRS